MVSPSSQNRLAAEKSPYLLQHADNPVDWFPWGEEAFAKARSESKPIFLSIGYSTCHWCHVMAHESFENPDTADLLNEGFIAIKVDREERPDVDRVYMGALQAMGISGGWPLSMFLTPELKPFYGGTYFPPDNRHERAGFPEILRRIRAIWLHKRNDVLESGDRIVAYLREMADAAGTTSIDLAPMVELCHEQLCKSFDETFGGFGDAPKFPRPVTLAFLARFHKHHPQAGADRMVLRTLQAMAQGGIRDHVGGGFHRYAVDERWRVPHFEKMLYDQAQLAHVYLDAAQWAHDDALADVAADIFDYVIRDLRLPGGGFASAEDADSPRPENPDEHGEGAFYLWTRRELTQVLGDDGALFAFAYGVEADGNVQHDPFHEFTGRNILFAAQDLSDVARFGGLDEGETRRRLSAARSRLLAARGVRPRPLRDDKVIAAWNGLMIGALARGARILNNTAYLEAAIAAAEFVLASMIDPSTGTLMRRYRDGEARHEAHLQDYAFLVEGLLDLFEATGTTRWLREALDLTTQQIALFADPERGGFYDTSGLDASVLVRAREQYDGAEPAGNSTAAMNLLRLGALTGDAKFRDRAAATVKAFSPWLNKQPSIMPYLVAAAMQLDKPPSQLVIAGERHDPSTGSLWRECTRRFLPETVKIPVASDEQGTLAQIIPYAGQVKQNEGKAVAYVCSDFACKLPVSEPEALGRLLDEL
jgi:uncharacterized protein